MKSYTLAEFFDEVEEERELRLKNGISVDGYLVRFNKSMGCYLRF